MDYEGFFAEKVAALRGEGRYRVFADLERRVGRFPKAMLHRDGVPREVTIWCSNDYLAMGHHPVVLEAMHEALDRSGARLAYVDNVLRAHLDVRRIAAGFRVVHDGDVRGAGGDAVLGKVIDHHIFDFVKGFVARARLSAAFRQGYLQNVPGRNGNDREGKKETFNLDASATYKIPDKVTLTFEGLNLTDEFNHQWVGGGARQSTSVYHHTGRQFYLGARMNF